MKKRILYVVTRAVTAGGVMSVVSKKIHFLTNAGYSVDVLSMTKCDKPFYDLPEKVKLICCGSNENFHVGIKEFTKAIKFIINNEYDIVISADAQYVTWILPFIRRKKSILEIHQSYDGLEDFYKRGSLAIVNLFIHKMMQRLCFAHYDKVVVLSKEDESKWNLHNTVVIPNFHVISNNIINSKQVKPRKKIICVGRYSFQKGFDLIIKIWKQVSIACPDWDLYYYGIIPSNKVEEDMKLLDAPTSFIIKGIEKNLSKIYSDAYLNVVSSRCESFSLTTIESMCYGVPTVSFDITGPRSIITDGENGCLVSCYNIEEAANVIINLINDESKRDYLSNNCKSVALLYTENAVMKRWIALFDE